MNTQAHKSAILSHLKSGKSITSAESYAKWGKFRLAARIHDLREEGYEISTVKEGSHARYFPIKMTLEND